MVLVDCKTQRASLNQGVYSKRHRAENQKTHTERCPLLPSFESSLSVFSFLLLCWFFSVGGVGASELGVTEGADGADRRRIRRRWPSSTPAALAEFGRRLRTEAWSVNARQEAAGRLVWRAGKRTSVCLSWADGDTTPPPLPPGEELLLRGRRGGEGRGEGLRACVCACDFSMCVRLRLLVRRPIDARMQYAGRRTRGLSTSLNLYRRIRETPRTPEEEPLPAAFLSGSRIQKRNLACDDM